ncbi:MAG: diguanylate cyclase [Spirochaetales bacterium]|nr:diguanylate cyclase [Spirochaetales bacterium]
MINKKRRHTIGFLTDQLDDQYHNSLWTGIDEIARENDVNLIVFTGKCLDVGHFFESSENVVYKMVNPDKIDGLVISSASLGNFISKEELLSFVHLYNQMPLVSLFTVLEGIPSVTIDNKRGMNEIVCHLIEHHHRRHIAYISGSESNDESEIRFEAYIEALVLHNIPFDPDLVFPGDFSTYSGEKAARMLLDERRVDCDAIVCANDGMAMGVLEVLTERGIKVPEDIALTGFDNWEEIQFLSPPLSTVHVPIKEVARKGTEILLDLINGKKVPGKIFLSTSTVLRQSCGCFSTHIKIPGGNELPGSLIGNDSEINIKRNSIIREVCSRLQLCENRKCMYEKYIRIFLARLLSDIKDSTYTLYDSINEALPGFVIERNKNITWQDIFEMLRKFVIMDLKDPHDIALAEELFHHSQVLIGKMYNFKRGRMKYIRARQDKAYRSLFTRVNNAVDLENLLLAIVETVQQFGIQFCFLSLFEEELETQKITPEILSQLKSRLVAELAGTTQEIHGTQGPVFPSIELIPGGIDSREKRFSWMLRILYSQDIKFGFIIFDLNPAVENVLDTLHDILCSGFMLTRLFDKRLIAEEALKTRTRELEESNKKLEEIDNLKNDFIANITHDFRSTLMIILNSADLGIKYEKINDPAITKWFSAIYNASVKLKSTIDRLLELGKMDAQGVKLNVRKVNLKKLIESIVDFYKSTVMNTQIRIINILPAEEIDNVFTDPEKIEEVFYNILSNALKFIDPRNGEIKIECRNYEDTVHIVIADNGIGIPKNKLEDIFDRFVQVDNARRFSHSGTGIGLAYTKQLIGCLKGNIWAESEGEGTGAAFFVELKKGKEMFGSEDFSDIETDTFSFHQDREILSRILKMEIQEKERAEGFSVIIRRENKEEEYDYHKGIILIVEDNEYIRDIAREYLERDGYMNFILAQDGKSGLHAAYSYKPDIIICDINMPRMKGDEFHDELVSNLEFASIPFIFLTAITRREVIIGIRKKGAIAVLPKPLDENDFLLTVEVNLKRYMNYRKTLKQSIIDELTGLHNRQTILRILRDHLAIRSYKPLSLIFFDIDHFKLFNDKFGHQIGDRVLTMVGATVKETIRTGDIAGRYGGEEFIIVLPETTIEGARVVADKLKQNIYSIPIHFTQQPVSITSSFGISSLIDNSETICKVLSISDLREIYEVGNSVNADWDKIDKLKSNIVKILISMADEAMYKAKSTICNSCGFSSIQDELFKQGICPQCGKETIIIGRNKVVLWKD